MQVKIIDNPTAYPECNNRESNISFFITISGQTKII